MQWLRFRLVGDDTEIEMVTDYDLIDQWKQWLKQRVGDTWTDRYPYAIFRLLNETRPHKGLTQMTEQDVVMFLAKLGHRTPSRDLLYLNGFRSFFSWAHDHGHIPSDPTSILGGTGSPQEARTGSEAAGLLVGHVACVSE